MNYWLISAQVPGRRRPPVAARHRGPQVPCLRLSRGDRGRASVRRLRLRRERAPRALSRPGRRHRVRRPREPAPARAPPPVVPRHGHGAPRRHPAARDARRLYEGPRAGRARLHLPRRDARGLANVLAKIAGFVCELAHDYYEDADAPIASDLADAAKIKSMKAPDGSYVFPRAEEVGRAFAAELLLMDSVRFA